MRFIPNLIGAHDSEYDYSKDKVIVCIWLYVRSSITNSKSWLLGAGLTWRYHLISVRNSIVNIILQPSYLHNGQAPSHYLNQCRLVYRRISASLGLNELRESCSWQFQLSISQNYIANAIYDNKCIGGNHTTIFLKSAKFKWRDNYIVNWLNRFEMVTFNKTRLVCTCKTSGISRIKSHNLNVFRLVL